MSDGKIIFDVEADTSKYNSAMNEAARTAEKTQDSINNSGASSSSKWGQVWIGMARQIGASIAQLGQQAISSLGNAIVDFTKMGIEYNAQMETYNAMLTRLLGSEEAAAAALEKMKEDAASSPFDLTSLAQANQMLISTGISADDARATINALGEAVAASGGGNDELVRMASNLQQIQNAGQATAMDIRQFAYAGIDIYGLLSDYTGMAVEDVKDLTVSYDVLSGALQMAAEEGGKYFGATASYADTLNGKMRTLKSTFKSVAGQVTEALSPAFKDVIDMIIEVLDNNDELIDSLAKVFSQIAEAIVHILPPLIDLCMPILQFLIDLISAILPVLISVIDAVIKVIQPIVDAILPVLNSLLSALQPIFEILTPLIQLFGDIFTKVFEIIWAVVGPIIEGIISAITGIITAVKDALEWLGILRSEAEQYAIDQAFAEAGGGHEYIANNLGFGDFGASIYEISMGWLGRKALEDTIIASSNLVRGSNQVKRHKTGLEFVPYDFYPAYLDYGERVLTREENIKFNALGGLNGIERAASPIVSTVSSSQIVINANFTGTIDADGYNIAQIVLRNLDDAAAFTLRG